MSRSANQKKHELFQDDELLENQKNLHRPTSKKQKST